MRLSEPSRLAASVQASLEGVEETLTLNDNRAASLVVGNYDQNIAHLERRLNIVAHVNGNQILLQGSREHVDHARRVLESLYATVKRGRAVARKPPCSGGFSPSAASPRRRPSARARTSRRGSAISAPASVASPRPAMPRRIPISASSPAMSSPLPKARLGLARPGWRWAMPCNCSRPAMSSG